MSTNYTPAQIAATIDHTQLKANTSDAQIEQLCQEAATYNFAAVCVPPTYVAMAKQLLQDATVKVATVIGFPLGYATTTAKAAEAKDAIERGADELDFVINISDAVQNKWTDLASEMQHLQSICRQANRIAKFILETALLTDEQIVACCQAAAKAEVDYVKTSTGFSTAGAKVAHIQLMRNNLPAHIKIKASGGIRNAEQAIAMLNAGADRLGCSAGVAIVSE